MKNKMLDYKDQKIFAIILESGEEVMEQLMSFHKRLKIKRITIHRYWCI